VSKVHLCNTFFEWELQQKTAVTLAQGLSAHHFFFQLHYLPLLYADPQDIVLLAKFPKKTYLECLEAQGFALPKMRLLSDRQFPPLPLSSYGPAQSVQTWAKERGLSYSIPPLEVVKILTSKIFSFENSPQLPESALLENASQAEEWCASTPHPKVLKDPLGFSGRGHLILRRPDYDFTQLSFPLIGEPWVERTLDFSTHFEIGKEISCVGQTRMENSKQGHFISCATGAHHEIDLTPLLTKIQAMGFFGPLSIDSFIYENGLHPIVEINPRLTMSSIAIKIAKKLHSPIHLSYSKTGTLLPSGYSKNLSIDRL